MVTVVEFCQVDTQFYEWVKCPTIKLIQPNLNRILEPSFLSVEILLYLIL